MPKVEEKQLMEKLESLRGKVQPEAMGTLDEAIEMARLIAKEKVPALWGRRARVSGLTRQNSKPQKPWTIPPKGFYNVKQVAERFGVSDKAVYKWIETGKVQSTTAAGYRGTLIPIDQFAPDQKEERRAQLQRLREKISRGGSIKVDEDEFPIGQPRHDH